MLTEDCFDRSLVRRLFRNTGSLMTNYGWNRPNVALAGLLNTIWSLGGVLRL